MFKLSESVNKNVCCRKYKNGVYHYSSVKLCVVYWYRSLIEKKLRFKLNKSVLLQKKSVTFNFERTYNAYIII